LDKLVEDSDLEHLIEKKVDLKNLVEENLIEDSNLEH
jgi:hypothetical protein